MLPKSCCKCPPCAPQENTYSIYAGLTRDAQAEILRVDEVSNDYNRCCCKPLHAMKLETRAYIPIYGDQSNSDYAHLAQDFGNDWQRLTRVQRQQQLTDLYRQNPVLVSMVRHGGQRCCALPCKCLSGFVCMDCCADGLDIYAGVTPESSPKELGLPFGLNKSNRIGAVTQPIYGGLCTPTLHLRAGESDEDKPFAKIEGPCIFGGWTEFCFDFKFSVSKFESTSRSADAALIIKRKPGSWAQGFNELFNDADNYTIEYNPEAKLSVTQKLSVVAGQILADYMYFDGTTEKCKCEDDSITCYCFYCSIVGWICPCYVIIPLKCDS
jgi:hypothetical protein